jgi:putative transposase
MAQSRRTAAAVDPKLARLTNEAEPDVLAFMSFPSSHRVKLHSTNEMDKQFLVGS